MVGKDRRRGAVLLPVLFGAFVRQEVKFPDTTGELWPVHRVVSILPCSFCHSRCRPKGGGRD